MIDRANWREEVRSRILSENRSFGLDIWDGWKDLVCDLVDKIEAASGARCDLFQVKEKFAGLRFYLAYHATNRVSSWIDEAEAKSFSICERCGASGSEKGSGGWYKTLCQPCFKWWDEGSDAGEFSIRYILRRRGGESSTT